MFATRLTVLVVALLAVVEIARASFALKETFKGDDFYDKWNWETFNDPTHGRVDYVTMKHAKNANLTSGNCLLNFCMHTVRLTSSSSQGWSFLHVRRRLQQSICVC
jgi:hypothetical protein